MMLMIIAILIVVGLCFGSFVNALVWRVHEQETESAKKKPRQKYLKELSISKGRSMCPHCKHELAAKDLLPLLSWLWLRGKCRYCREPIAAQYPLVEALTAALFAISYLCWPWELHGAQVVAFVLWLPLLTGLMALTVYDLRWMLLPNRILFKLYPLAALLAVVEASSAVHQGRAVMDTALAVLIGGGVFYVLYQVSSGKWIGGGDVKLGWLLGLIVATPGRSILVIFLASLIGSLISLPLLVSKKLRQDSVIPFGPLLIAATVIVLLFGHSILHWYQHSFFPDTL